MEPAAEPSIDLVDVTRVSLGMLRSAELIGLARATADASIDPAGVQIQDPEQYEPD